MISITIHIRTCTCTINLDTGVDLGFSEGGVKPSSRFLKPGVQLGAASPGNYRVYGFEASKSKV